MQCAMKFFEVMPKGAGQGLCSQKVAVKLPGKSSGESSGGNSDGFAEIMSALMSMSPEQLNQSLEKLDWVPMAGDGGQMVPLIDLSNIKGQGGSMITALLNGAGNKGANPDLVQLKMQWFHNGQAFNAAEQSAAGEDVAQSTTAIADAISEKALGEDVAADPLAEFPGKGIGIGTELAAERFAGQMPKGNAVGRGDNGLDAAALKTNASVNDDLARQIVGTASNKTGVDGGQQPMDVDAAEQVQAIDPEAATAADKVVKNNLDSSKAKMKDVSPIGNSVSDTVAVKNADGENKDPAQDFKSSRERYHHEIQSEGRGEDGNAAPSGGIDGSTAQTTASSDKSFHSMLSRTDGSSDAVREAAKSDKSPEAPKEMQQDVIRQIVQRMSLRTEGRQSQMQISLKPEYLGNLRMEVMAENQQVTVRMTAESHAVKQIIEHNLHVLKAELQQHGLQIHKFDVQVSQDSDLWRSSQEQADFGRQARQGGQGNGRHHGGRAFDSDETVGRDTRSRPGNRGGAISEVDFFA